jgi:hypothetical protein
MRGWRDDEHLLSDRAEIARAGVTAPLLLLTPTSQLACCCPSDSNEAVTRPAATTGFR